MNTYSLITLEFILIIIVLIGCAIFLHYLMKEDKRIFSYIDNVWDELEAYKNTNESEFASIKESQQSLKRIVVDTSREIDLLRKEIESSKGVFDNFKGEIQKNFSDSYTAIKADINNVVEGYKFNFTKQSEQIDNINKNLESFADLFNEVNRDIAKMDKVIDSVSKRTDANFKSIVELSEYLKESLKDSFENISTQFAKINEELKESSTNYIDISKSLSANIENVNDLEVLINQKSDNLESKIADIKSDVESYIETINKFDTVNNDYDKLLDNAKEALSNVNELFDSSKAHINNYANLVDTFTTDIAQLKDTNNPHNFAHPSSKVNPNFDANAGVS